MHIFVYTYQSRQINTQLFTIPTNSRTCLGTRVRAEVFFFHSHSGEQRDQTLPGRRLEVPAVRRPGPGTLNPAFPGSQSPGRKAMPCHPSSQSRSPAEKVLPQQPRVVSRDQPPSRPLPESLKVTEEISIDIATGPQEGAPDFPAALKPVVSARTEP